MSKKKTKAKAKGELPYWDESGLLKVFKDSKKPLTLEELYGVFKPGKKEKSEFHECLTCLENSGRIIRLKGAYGLTERMSLVAGRLEVTRRGLAFVIPDDKRRKDILIRQENLGEGRHGDKVVAAIQPGGGGKIEGRVARIIERALTELPVRVEKRLAGNLFLTRPCDVRNNFNMMVHTDAQEFAIGDILIASIEERSESNLWSGRFVRYLGRESDIMAQEALVKAIHKVPADFPPEALAQAARLPEVPAESDFADRRDLRRTMFVTIDGAKARDFDDAIHVRKLRNRKGGYNLMVAIADVTHYVPSGSPLDKEAELRGNSYYFPRSVEPMFPERLSNGLCSLNPKVPRLVMVADMTFDADGHRIGAEIYPAVIRSKARLTYGQVNRALLLADEAEREAIAPVMPMLVLAEELARKTLTVRRERGSLDFDLPEPEILINLEGETEAIRPKSRHFGNQIVEEFMLAANEAVAEFLREKQIPFLYREHPEPDNTKLETLVKLLETTDLAESLPDEVGPKFVRELLNTSAGSDLEYLVNKLVLRSMMQAGYTPEERGHFGLASECYCHFTSPIRRYADMVVHRALKAALGLVPMSASGLKGLGKRATLLNACERRAMEAEREILRRVTIHFLQGKIGQEFEGVVSALADFGFWVELTEVMADGMVRLSTLTDDYYNFNKDRQEILGTRTGRSFRMGQKLRVSLTDVSTSRLEANLEVVGEAGQLRKRSSSRKWRGRRRRK